MKLLDSGLINTEELFDMVKKKTAAKSKNGGVKSMMLSCG